VPVRNYPRARCANCLADAERRLGAVSWEGWNSEKYPPSDWTTPLLVSSLLRPCYGDEKMEGVPCRDGIYYKQYVSWLLRLSVTVQGCKNPCKQVVLSLFQDLARVENRQSNCKESRVNTFSCHSEIKIPVTIIGRGYTQACQEQTRYVSTPGHDSQASHHWIKRQRLGTSLVVVLWWNRIARSVAASALMEACPEV
jgi:hypothetical protein